MNRKTVKPILMSALSALAFGAVGAGATFALFTDKAETHIDVEAGKVDISSSIAVDSVKELGDVAVPANAGIYTSSIGATTQVNAANNAVTLSKWTPGDKASFLITTKNFSNVKTQTRLIASHTSTTNPDLYDALTIKYEKVASINEIGTDLFRWNLIPASNDLDEGQTISVVRVTIEFKNIGNEITVREQGINNQFQEANCTIKFTQQAVQGNAVLTNYVDSLNAILEGSTTSNSNLFDAIAETHATVADLKANDVVYSASLDKFFYSAEVSGGQEHEYFKVYDAMPLVQKWSVYAATNDSWAGNLKLEGIGFDAGNNTGALNISYVGTGAARENYIRTTNSASDVTINAPLDTVHHYGTAGNLNIIAVAGTSYHEHGKVAFAEIAKGRIALEKESKVEQIHVASIKDNQGETTNVFDSIIIAKDSEVDLPKLSRDDVDIAAGGTLVVALQAGTETVPQNGLDYVWLTKQGIYEQIKVSDNDDDPGTTWADETNSATTQNAAQQIANNIGRDVATGEVSQPVSITGVDAETVIVLNENRDLVVVEAANPEVKIISEAATEAVADAVEETGLKQAEKEAEAAAAKAIANFEEDKNLDYVACIGATGYLSLNAAIAAAKAADGVETITILKPITSVDGFLVDADVNINLNGKTITVSVGGDTNRAFKIDAGKTVSIYNGTIDAQGGGTTSANGYGCYGAIRAEVNSKIELKNLTLKNYRPYGLNIKLLGATAILDNVKIVSSYGGGIEVTDDKGGEGTIRGYAKLTNCDIRQSGYYDHCSSPVSVSGNSKVDVYSSYFEGCWGAYVFSSGGTINVYGGEWKANLTSTQNAGAVAIVQSDNSSYSAAVSVINIYDGTFRGTFSQSANPVDSIVIHGGKFDHDPSNYLADGLQAYINDEGWYVLTHEAGDILNINKPSGQQAYTSLRTAVEEASAGDTIVLFKDIEDNNGYESAVNITKNITIEGNGHSFTSNCARTFGVDSENIKVTFRNLASINTSGYVDNYPRGINIIGSGAEVIVDHCEVSCQWYAINIPSAPTSYKLTVKNNSYIHGWAAINAWAPNGTINCSDSRFYSVNDKSYDSNGWNDFSTIVFNTNAGETQATFTRCTIQAQNQTQGNVQTLVAVRCMNMVLTFNQCSWILDGEALTDSKDIMDNFAYYYAEYRSYNDFIFDGVTVVQNAWAIASAVCDNFEYDFDNLVIEEGGITAHGSFSITYDNVEYVFDLSEVEAQEWDEGNDYVFDVVIGGIEWLVDLDISISSYEDIGGYAIYLTYMGIVD